MIKQIVRERKTHRPEVGKKNTERSMSGGKKTPKKTLMIMMIAVGASERKTYCCVYDCKCAFLALQPRH